MHGFFAFAEHFKSTTCILSVESYPDGSYGNIRIVAGNRAYLNIAHSVNTSESEKFTSAFIPNSPYERYIPKNTVFEADCFRCVVKGEVVHRYLRPPGMELWMQTTLTPLSDQSGNVNDDFIDIAETWLTTLGDDPCIFLTTDEAWAELRQKNPTWYKSMYSAGARSIIMFPLKANDVILGFIWAINFDVSQSSRIRDTLELTTFFIASEIANNQLLHRMEVLSTTDLLTGIYNRNAMNNRVDSLLNDGAPEDQIGIVFADLNGLKQVNDENGHFAGDMLLKNAAIT
ncbi:MAG: diguanylate cyclase, partial [Oscillospiraceae bacterium]|nr:diguanylate cyclase [Oscillospiraceae bacterium]